MLFSYLAGRGYFLKNSASRAFLFCGLLIAPLAAFYIYIKLTCVGEAALACISYIFVFPLEVIIVFIAVLFAARGISLVIRPHLSGGLQKLAIEPAVRREVGAAALLARLLFGGNLVFIAFNFRAILWYFALFWPDLYAPEWWLQELFIFWGLHVAGAYLVVTSLARLVRRKFWIRH